MSKHKLGSIALSLVFWFSIISLIFESGIYFQEFEAPGDAYEYKYESTEYQIIEGENTACVIGNEETIYLVRKNQKWKIPFHESSVAKYIEEENDSTIYVQEYNKSGDYYITVYFEGYDVSVSDNLNSKFFKISEEYYGACVTNPDSDYVLYVGDKEHYVFK